jgi:hypothetical protein
VSEVRKDGTKGKDKGKRGKEKMGKEKRGRNGERGMGREREKRNEAERGKGRTRKRKEEKGKEKREHTKIARFTKISIRAATSANSFVSCIPLIAPDTKVT